MPSNKALIIVDVQNDFCPDGALAVKDGDAIVPVLNKYIDVFAKEGWPVLASRDWHPPRTKHFKEHGGLWPVHCVEGTPGAAFHPKLRLPSQAVVLSKGADPEKDGYSAFEALDDNGRDLMAVLRGLDVGELLIGGLATDYCVRSTVLEAVNDFKVSVLADAVMGVDLNPGDSQKALEEMAAAGAGMITFDAFLKEVA